MAVNFRELKAIVKIIEKNPERWRQGNWAWWCPDKEQEVVEHNHCDSSFCVAGWAVQRAGLPLEWEKYHDRWEATRVKGGSSIHEEASKILGLTSSQAERLFAGANTLTDIKDIIAKWKAQAQYEKQLRKETQERRENAPADYPSTARSGYQVR